MFSEHLNTILGDMDNTIDSIWQIDKKIDSFRNNKRYDDTKAQEHNKQLQEGTSITNITNGIKTEYIVIGGGLAIVGYLLLKD